jgi:hypothetical protein
MCFPILSECCATRMTLDPVEFGCQKTQPECQTVESTNPISGKAL